MSVSYSCPRFGKFFGHCRFKPRYDVVDEFKPDPMFLMFAANKPAPATPRRVTYIHDVCERCGMTRERPRPL